MYFVLVTISALRDQLKCHHLWQEGIAIEHYQVTCVARSRQVCIYYAESGPEPITDTTNLYVHWNAQSYLGGVQQMAYDHLSIPAMSAECERVFSDTKLTISPNRSRLKEDTIEATECLVQWTRAGW
jgi:hypothetical protein